MRSADAAWFPLTVLLGGCGLLLDLDPADQERKKDGGAPDGGIADADVRDVVLADVPLPDAGPSCGNGVVDPGEDCDDGNVADDDGCDHFCLFSCTSQLDCQNPSACDGTETCDPVAHLCMPGLPVSCATDACHVADCEAGCEMVLVDGDGDGHAPDSSSCGDDCDDGDPSVYAGAPELCDGLDNDCNGEPDDSEGSAACYVDSDVDGFGGFVVALESCDPCPDGTTLRAGDCADGVVDAYPGQDLFSSSPFLDDVGATSYDYDCDSFEEPRWTDTAAPCRFLGGLLGCARGGWVSAVPACGAAGDWQECNRVLLATCVATRSRRTQECR